MSARIAYLNGTFDALDETRVSAMDRGFLFGDGVYEVIPAYTGYPFRLDEHLDRLDRSLAAIRVPPPHDRAQWRRLIEELIERNGGGDLSVYVQVTRGIAPERDHAFPETPQPTVFATASLLRRTDPAWLREGVAVVTHEDIRWRRCDIKATTLLANVLLRQDARESGAHEALLVADGTVTEGSASNVFAVVDDTIVTPPKDHRILPGITRDLVVELARANSLNLVEQSLPVATLRGAEEVWITSSTRELLPVTRIDEHPVGRGVPGPHWTHMDNLLQDYKHRWLLSRNRNTGDEA